MGDPELGHPFHLLPIPPNETLQEGLHSYNVGAEGA